MQRAAHRFFETVNVVAAAIPIEARDSIVVWAFAPAMSVEATPPVSLPAVSIPTRLFWLTAFRLLDVEELVVMPIPRVTPVSEKTVEEVAMGAL